MEALPRIVYVQPSGPIKDTSSSSPGFSQTLNLKSGTASSQAIIEWDVLRRLPEVLQASGLPRRMFIVTDTKVGELYSEPIQNLLQGAGFAPNILTIPSGESSKSLDCWQQILDWLVENMAERQEPLVALGGGVVGDLTGFVAACYHRGIPLIQVPTSLLAQVDSAIGGKTGINHIKGKNLIGAIYQPMLIIVDPACLLTLPDRVYREGWAEIVKYGVILDADLFQLLETHAPSLYARKGDASLVTKIITRCIQLKMDVVGADERDGGLRNILNYGHTFGHALEALTDYGTWLHGEAVSTGMEVAAHIAVSRGLLSSEDALRQCQLLQALGLPIHCSGMDTESIITAMQRDKKVRAGRMRWVLPTHIGHAEMYDDIPLEMVRDAIEAVRSVE
ncbi:MAG TPA: 3-dehydroquinate synthase [Ktedonobacteraceae bacterium]